MIRAVLFDLDDTLIDRARAAREASQAWRGRTRFPEKFDGSLVSRTSGRSCDVRRLRLEIARRARPFDGAVSLLHALRSRGCHVAVVSNGSHRVQRMKIRSARLEPLVDQVLVSGADGPAKPSPLMLRRALDRARVEPAHAIFVGNDPHTDIAAAAAAGVSSFWIEGVTPYPMDAPKPNAHGSLRDFGRMMGC